jgi:hypothetical protein
MAKAIEAVKNLMHSREELSGVGRMGCCDSRRWNRRDLIRWMAQNHPGRRYKPQGEILMEFG